MDQSNQRNRTKFVIIAIFFLIVVGATLFFYYFYSSGPEALPSPLVRGILKIEKMGGLCAGGETCSSTYDLSSNGSFYFNGNSGSVSSGVISEAVTLIDDADFKTIKKYPYTETCPTAYDGQKTIYTFYFTMGGSETLDSCEYVVPADDELFTFANNLYNQAQSQFR